MLNWISGAWCKTMHRRQAMWPIHGRYLCPKCLRVYEVKWQEAYVSARQTQLPSCGELSIPSTAPVTQLTV
jgi:hypothetical protein